MSTNTIIVTCNAALSILVTITTTIPHHHHSHNGIFKVTALTLLPCTRKSTGGLPPAALQASIGIYLFIYFDSLNCHVHLCHQTTDLCKVTTFLFTLISWVVISIYVIYNPPLSGKCFLFNLSLINIDDTEWYWEILLACLCARGSGLMASL